MTPHKLALETCFTRAGCLHEHQFGAVNPPVYRTSTLIYPDFQTLKDGITMFGHWTDYTRNGSANTFLLQDALCTIMPGAYAALPTPTGISAITTTLISLLKAGDHLLITDSVYGPVRAFCENFLRPRGVAVTYYDPLIGADIAAYIQKTTRVIYMEQPGSLTLEIQDVPAIAQAAQARGITTVIDSTWASPFFFNPFEYGVDIVVQSLSKYVAGHADVMMGAIAFAHAPIYVQIESVYRSLGICVSPDDTYLVLRGLRTLAPRMHQHMASGLAFTHWLQTRSEITRILYPALETDPGYNIWKRDFKGASSLFSVVLRPCNEASLARMMNNLHVFMMGQSWGAYESLVYPILSPIERTITPWQETGYLLRLHIGLEALEDLKADFAHGLELLTAEEAHESYA